MDVNGMMEQFPSGDIIIHILCDIWTLSLVYIRLIRWCGRVLGPVMAALNSILEAKFSELFSLFKMWELHWIIKTKHTVYRQIECFSILSYSFHIKTDPFWIDLF